MLIRFIKFSQWLSKLIINLSAISIGLLALLVFYQVLTRFVFNSPSELSEALARMIMVWMVYLTMGCVFHSGSMIAIDFFIDKTPKMIGIWGHRIVTMINLVILLLLAYIGFDFALQVSSQNVALLEVSAFWMYISIPVGCIFSIPSVLEWHLLNVEKIECLSEFRDDNEQLTSDAKLNTKEA